MNRAKKRCAYHCEIEAAFAIIGGKWKAGIIWHIGTGAAAVQPVAHSAGKREPPDARKTVAELETDGLVTRTMYPEIPPRVEYELTDAGKALIPILQSISEWVTTYCPKTADMIE